MLKIRMILLLST